MLITLSRPKSRGSVQLSSSDPLDHPTIQPNYLTHQDDVTTLVAGLRLANQLAQTAAMRAAGAVVWSPATHPHKYCEKEEYDSDLYWECYVRHWTFTIYHPVGTCAMGTVVDNRSMGTKSWILNHY